MKIGQICLIGLIGLVAILNFFYLLPPVVNWDEGTHALWGFKIWWAIKDLNWNWFWDLTRQQFAYPPLGSWIIALVNLPFEFSMNLARFSSSLGFMVGGVLLFLVGRVLSSSSSLSSRATPPKAGESRDLSQNKLNYNFQVGISIKLWCMRFLGSLRSLGMTGQGISLFLFLTSPAILFYSVVVFKESWGMALTLLTLYLYFLSSDRKSFKYYFLTGLSLVLLFFEKYNYALLLVLTLGLEGVIEIVLLYCDAIKKTRPYCGGTKVGSFLSRQLTLFFPLFLFALWWILTPTNKWPWFLEILRSDWNPVTVGVGKWWEYLLFYVQSIRVSYVFSDILFLLIVICYLLAVKDLWKKKIRVLWVFFTLNLILGTLHSINLQDRYILTSVPALFLVAGYELFSLSSRGSPQGDSRDLSQMSWGKRLKIGITNKVCCGRFLHAPRPWRGLVGMTKRIIVCLLVILVFFDFLKLPSLLKSNATHMLLSPMYNEIDYKDTLFNFNKDEWPKEYQISNIKNQKYISKIKNEEPETVIDYILDNVDIRKPINYIGWTAEISPDWVELRRQLRLREQVKQIQKRPDLAAVELRSGLFLVTIEVKPNSRLYTYDYKRANLWQLEKVREVGEEWGKKLLKEKEFRELGVIVRIYRL